MRLKFRVIEISELEHGVNIKMSPVQSQDAYHENKAFWDATPSGSLEVFVNASHRQAVDGFTPGQEYYLDLTAAG